MVNNKEFTHAVQFSLSPSLVWKCNAAQTVRLCHLCVARSAVRDHIGTCKDTSKPIVKGTETNGVRIKNDYVTLLDYISTLPVFFFIYFSVWSLLPALISIHAYFCTLSYWETHKNTLSWTPLEEGSAATWQHTTLTRDRHACPRR